MHILPRKMRSGRLLILTLLYIQSSAQGIAGKYEDFSGHHLELYSDSTFRFDWRFDLIHTWAKGNWSISGVKIHLQFVNVYDTLVRAGRPDSLVLSIDQNSSKINNEEFGVTLLVSGRQESDGITTELFKKGKRLFLVDKNGRLNRSKHRGIWPQNETAFGL